MVALGSSQQWFHACRPGKQTNLEHLNEGDAEVQIGEVTADQAQAEEEADWDDGAQVDAPRHLDRFPAIEQCRVPSEKLCHDGRKGQVEGGQDDRVGCQISASCSPSSQSSIGVFLPKSSVERIHLLKRITEELREIQTLRLCVLANCSIVGEPLSAVPGNCSTHATYNTGCMPCFGGCELETSGLTVGRTGLFWSRGWSPEARVFSSTPIFAVFAVRSGFRSGEFPTTMVGAAAVSN